MYNFYEQPFKIELNCLNYSKSEFIYFVDGFCEIQSRQGVWKKGPVIQYEQTHHEREREKK